MVRQTTYLLRRSFPRQQLCSLLPLRLPVRSRKQLAIQRNLNRMGHVSSVATHAQGLTNIHHVQRANVVVARDDAEDGSRGME